MQSCRQIETDVQTEADQQRQKGGKRWRQRIKVDRQRGEIEKTVRGK